MGLNLDQYCAHLKKQGCGAVLVEDRAEERREEKNLKKLDTTIVFLQSKHLPYNVVKSQLEINDNPVDERLVLQLLGQVRQKIPGMSRSYLEECAHLDRVSPPFNPLHVYARKAWKHYKKNPGTCEVAYEQFLGGSVGEPAPSRIVI